MTWWMIDLIIVFSYGLQHSLLTTKFAINLYNKILPDYSWNFIYSLTAVATLFLGFEFWQSSNIYLWMHTPGSLSQHFSLILLSCSLFLFFFCFKYTTSFWQWLGVKQLYLKAKGKKLPPYYRIRQNGIKKYIRFPHHTCLIFFFWAHPTMTLDTLLLAIGATIYLYVGTYHQDLRGMSIIGEEWSEYRKKTSLLLPSLSTYKRMISDFKIMLLHEDKVVEEKSYN